jgi:hypothetical protein
LPCHPARQRLGPCGRKDAKRAVGGVSGRTQILYWILSETEGRLTGSIGCTHVTWLDSTELVVAICLP